MHLLTGHLHFHIHEKTLEIFEEFLVFLFNVLHARGSVEKFEVKVLNVFRLCEGADEGLELHDLGVPAYGLRVGGAGGELANVFDKILKVCARVFQYHNCIIHDAYPPQ